MFGDVREEAICQTLAERLGAVGSRQLPPALSCCGFPNKPGTAHAQSATLGGSRGPRRPWESGPSSGRLGDALERALDHDVEDGCARPPARWTARSRGRPLRSL